MVAVQGRGQAQPSCTRTFTLRDRILPGRTEELLRYKTQVKSHLVVKGKEGGGIVAGKHRPLNGA